MVITEKDLKLHKLMKTMLQSIVDVKGTGSDLEVVFKHYAGLHDQSMHGNRYGSTVDANGQVVASLVHGGNLQNRANEHFSQDEPHARALEAQRQARALRNAEQRHAEGTNTTWKWQVGDRSYTNAQTIEEFGEKFKDIEMNTTNLTTTDIKTLNAFGASLENVSKGYPALADSIKSLDFSNLTNQGGKCDNFGNVKVDKNGDVKVTMSSALTNSPTSATTALTHAEAKGMQPKGCTTLAYAADKVLGKAMYTKMSKDDSVTLTCKDADGNIVSIFDDVDGTGTIKADSQHIARILDNDVKNNPGLFGTDVSNSQAATGKKDYVATFSTLVAAPALGNKDINDNAAVQKFGAFMNTVMDSKGGVSKSQAYSLRALKARIDDPSLNDDERTKAAITYKNAQSAVNYYRRQTGLTKSNVAQAQASIHGRTVMPAAPKVVTPAPATLVTRPPKTTP